MDPKNLPVRRSNLEVHIHVQEYKCIKYKYKSSGKNRSSLTPAVVGQGVAVVTVQTVGAGRAVGVVQAPEAPPGPRVT